MKKIKLFALRAMLVGMLFLSAYACQSEDINNSPRQEFKIKSNEPVNVQFSATARLLSADANGTCFTVENTIWVHFPGKQAAQLMIFISTGGPGCPDIISSPGGGGGSKNYPGGNPPLASYSYNGEWIDDAVLNGNKASEFFDNNPQAYSDYTIERNKVCKM